MTKKFYNLPFYIKDNNDGDRYKTIVVGPSKPYSNMNESFIPYNETEKFNATNFMITQLHADE